MRSQFYEVLLPTDKQYRKIKISLIFTWLYFNFEKWFYFINLSRFCSQCHGHGLSSSLMEDFDSLFAIPSSSSVIPSSSCNCYGVGRFRHRSSMASNMSSVSSANHHPVGRAILIVELPAEILVKILSYLSFLLNKSAESDL